MVFLIIVALLILFDIAAYVGGADSREWEKRQNWFGSGGRGY